MLWSMRPATCSASRNRDLRRRVLLAAALALAATSLLSPAASAQNNTGYPTGTKCGDLVEPRRSACNDAFDPRPNPREIINKPPSNAVTPPAARPLGQDAHPSNPKAGGNLPPPIITKQHK